VDGLLPGEYVTPEDLVPLLERIQPGDIAVVRTGITLTGGNTDEKDEFGNPNRHYSISGFHADCVPLLAEKQISVLASDSPSDTYPCLVEGLDGPP
jgi:kynurenine formamidase